MTGFGPWPFPGAQGARRPERKETATERASPSPPQRATTQRCAKGLHHPARQPPAPARGPAPASKGRPVQATITNGLGMHGAALTVRGPSSGSGRAASPDGGHGTPPRRTRNRAEARATPARLRRPVCAPASPAASPGDRREALPPPAQHGRSNAMRVKEALAEAAGQAAASYLEGRGFRVLDRNWRSGSEILPIIAAERRVLVVIDLRVRAGTRHGTPLEAISADRRQTMRGLAARWLADAREALRPDPHRRRRPAPGERGRVHHRAHPGGGLDGDRPHPHRRRHRGRRPPGRGRSRHRPGLPATILTGLPDTVLREARDRVRAAIINSGERWPSSKITVGLYPAMLPKRGSAYDLAIAIAIMAANGDLPAPPEGDDVPRRARARRAAPPGARRPARRPGRSRAPRSPRSSSRRRTRPRPAWCRA